MPCIPLDLIKEVEALVHCTILSEASLQTISKRAPLEKTGAGAVDVGFKNWYNAQSIPASEAKIALAEPAASDDILI